MDWSIDGLNAIKRGLDSIMRFGNKANRPDEFGSYPPVCPKWIWKPEFAMQFNAIVNWIAGIPCDIDCNPILPNRGLWFAGNPGTGKSTLMRAIQRYCAITSDYRSPHLPQVMVWRHAKDITSEYAEKGAIALAQFSEEIKTLIIDDLGSEDIETKHYGNDKNVIEEILSRRYDRNLMTMVTTNITTKQVESFYKVRIYDRVREMFNIIEFVGESHRKQFNPNI